MRQRYVVALGSNRRHHRHGGPRRVLAAALEALTEQGMAIEATSPVIITAPLGHSRRRYANAAVLLRAELTPEALLETLKAIERSFGRRLRGRPWSDRVLDLDILLWDGGAWTSGGLTIPHPRFRRRSFALQPAAAIAPTWCDPLTGYTLRQLHARLTRTSRLPIGHTR